MMYTFTAIQLIVYCTEPRKNTQCKRPPGSHLEYQSRDRPFDSRYAVSYWWSSGTERLSPTVFEIFGPNRPKC